MVQLGKVGGPRRGRIPYTLFQAHLIGDVRGVILVSQWIIDPVSSTHCSITHISRFDTRGRGPSWYDNVSQLFQAVNLLMNE